MRCAGPRQLNRLGDEGGCALAEALLGNSRLQRLGLCANRLGAQVPRRLIASLTVLGPAPFQADVLGCTRELGLGLF